MFKKLKGTLEKLNNEKIKFLLFLSFFLIPIKLSFALVPILLLIFIYILRDFSIKDLFCGSNKYFFLFLIVALLVSPFSLDFKESTRRLFTLCYYSLLLPASIKYLKKENYTLLFSLMALGQCISSIHTVMQETFGNKVVGEFFVGKLTEAGQLALTIPLMFGILYFKRQEISRGSVIYSVLFFLACVASGFLGANGKLFGFYLFIPFFIFSVIKFFKAKDITSVTNFIYLYFPICLASFLLNLKRGPWIGCAVALFIFLFIYNKKLLTLFLSFLILIFFFVSPIRERILSSENHFFIRGGRASIWEVGKDFAIKYPLGVGYKQSRNLSLFSYDIPANLKHFHNNFLNIEVEFGIFCLILYILWIFFTLKQGFGNKDDTSILVSLCFLSFQVAGIVEFNFGDSEILLLMFLLISIIFKNSILDNKEASCS